MEAVVPTLNYLRRHADKIVIISHKGRPSGHDPSLSLARDAVKLSRLLKHKVHFLPFGPLSAARAAIQEAPAGSVFLLENIRFWRGEEDNDRLLAQQLASLGDYFVNDAFAVCHRTAASVVGVARCTRSFAGLLLEKEIKELGSLLKHPKRPFVVLVGGGKAADKLPVIHRLRSHVDAFLLGGAGANTLFSLAGGQVKRSLIDTNRHDYPELKKLLRYKNLVMPTDYIWQGGKILDLGPETTATFVRLVRGARTILWSGPLGLAEKVAFAKSSVAVADAIAKNRRAVSITGGGETVAFLRAHKFDSSFSFVSTGGSAMLDFLSGKKLPGIRVLERSR